MNYSGLKKYDIANGDGVRISLFVSGCENHCPGCFNPKTWDTCYGDKFTKNTLQEIIDFLGNPYISGLSLLGGDPMLHVNQECVAEIVKTVKAAYPDKTIWMWTGYTLPELLDESQPCHTQYTEEILKHVDVVVDGRFVQELKMPGLKYKGSSNQRVLVLKDGVPVGRLDQLPTC